MTDQLQEYNGWTNRPTWLMNLLLTNEEPLYHEARELVRDFENEREAAEALQEFVEDLTIQKIAENGASYPDSASLGADLMDWALSWVEWGEIAEALREE